MKNDLKEYDPAVRSYSPSGQRGTTRREFVQLLSASMAAAGLSGCGRRPPEAIVPYVHMPETVVPGKPQFYASTLALAGLGRGVVIETHEGRPTRLDGNRHHPASLGAIDIFAQAAVLDLYDGRRARTPTHGHDIAGYDALATALADARGRWTASNGAGLAILTEPDSSPSLHDVLSRLQQRWPAMQWFQHDTLSSHPARSAARLLFDRPLDAVARPERARIVVSFDRDILGPGPAQTAMARQFSSTRDPSAGRSGYSRWYAVESTPGLTGAAADHRLSLRATEVEAALEQLAAALGILEGVGNGPLPAAWLRGLVSDLRDAGRSSLTLVGEHCTVRAHALGMLVNERLGAPDRTLSYIDPVVPFPDGDLADLANAIDAGSVTSLLMLCHDPLATAPGDVPLADLLGRLDFCLHHASYRRAEPERPSFWHVPRLHELESWGDLRAFDGTASLVQPAITPLFSGLTRSELLRLAAGEPAPRGHEIVRAYWRDRRAPGFNDEESDEGFDEFWRTSLSAGVVRDTAAPTRRPRAADAARLPSRGDGGGAGLCLHLARDESLWDGRYVRNHWLQELPRPMSKVVWGHCALLAPETAKKLGVVTDQRLEIETAAGSVEVSAFVLPGQAEDQISLSLCTDFPTDHGGATNVKSFHADVSNSYRLLQADGGRVVADVEVTPLSRKREVITTQRHFALSGKHIIRDATLSEYLANPDLFHDEPAEHPPEHSLYPPPPEGEYAWAMTVDLNTCIGCNACTIACQSENNIPVVGPQEAYRGRTMHWIRVDRYDRGDARSQRTFFQPVPCMHCEYAPCELVCPTEATLHDDEGLNVMVYNRCIGTRDCSQNCPYKVRRFNWLDYNPYEQESPLSIAQLNPDVTVRSRGVMEKCTYCIQRISRARRRAKSENRAIEAGEVVTACQSACPVRAITFGDLKNPESLVTELKKSPRNYDLLGHLNTRPRTSYLARLRNPNADLEE